MSPSEYHDATTEGHAIIRPEISAPWQIRMKYVET